MATILFPISISKSLLLVLAECEELDVLYRFFIQTKSNFIITIFVIIKRIIDLT